MCLPDWAVANAPVTLSSVSGAIPYIGTTDLGALAQRQDLFRHNRSPQHHCLSTLACLPRSRNLSFDGFDCAQWVIDGYCSFENFRTICQRSCGACPTAAPTSAPLVLAYQYAPAAPELAVGGVPSSVSSRAPNFTFGLQVGSLTRATLRILSSLRSTSSAGKFYPIFI